MYSHVACDVMKERTLYLLKPSSLIWHLMPYLFLFTFSTPQNPSFYCTLGANLECFSHEGVSAIESVSKEDLLLPAYTKYECTSR